MKKLFVIVLAAIGMVSCMNTDEVIEVNNDNAIAFADAFIENSVRAMIDETNPLNTFNVWGYMVEDVQDDAVTATVFEGKEVTNPEGAGWTYSPAQYWVPGFIYNFQALSSDGGNGWEVTAAEAGQVTKVAFTNNDGTEDLIYATASVKAPALGDHKTVSLEFNHQLAKVMFTINTLAVQNAIAPGFTVKAEAIKMEVPQAGELNLVSGAWTVGAEKTTLEMEVGEELLTIPANYTYGIKFNVNLYKGDEFVSTLKEMTSNIKYNIEKGKAYNFVADVTPEKMEMTTIDFDTIVNEWVDNNLGLDVDDTKTVHIKSADALKAFADKVNAGESFKGKTVVLDADIDLSSSTRAAAEYVEWTPIGHPGAYFEGTFDGKGHKVLNFQVTALEGHAGLFGYARATIKNLTVENVKLVAKHYAGGIVGQGYAKLENCHAVNVDITVSVKELENGTFDYGDKAGAIIGQNCEGYQYVKNSTAKNVTIKGYRDLGGIAGMAHRDNTVSGCEVENITITQDLTNAYQATVPTTLGAVVGRQGSNATIADNTEANVEVGEVAIISDKAGLEAAAKAGVTTIDATGVVIEGTSSFNHHGVTVIGATFKNENGDGIALRETISGTFKNCVFEGSEAIRWAYAKAGETVVFEDCVIKTDFRGFHFDGMAGDVLFKNCEINGFNAYGGEGTATFEGCTFGCDKSTYAGLNIYSNTVLKDCTFNFISSKTNFIDMEGTDKTLAITGCTVTLDGAAADIKNYIGGSKLAQNTVTVNGEYISAAGAAICNTAAQLIAALANDKDVVLNSNITVAAGEHGSNGYGATGIQLDGGVIDGNGKKVSANVWTTWDSAISATGGTIKNLTVANAMRGIFMPGASGDVYIDNVIFDNVIYTFNSDAGNKNYGVYISNSTLNGWTSHSDVHKEVVYTNCNFGQGNGYAFCRPYGPTSFVGCNFAAGFEVEAVGKITFKNCTIGGVALTAENLSTLVIGESIKNAAVVVSTVDELKDALDKGVNVSVAKAIEIEGKEVILDLNGKTIFAASSSAIVAKPGATVTIKNGKVIAHESVVSAQGGKVIVESGEFVSTGTAVGSSPATYRYSVDSREGGEIIINGGTFKSNNGMINVSSPVTINGGKFENVVEKTMTRHFAYVSSVLTINDGEFYGKANGAAGGCFFCGAAANGKIIVNGGKFTSLWTSGSVNRIFESYAGGSSIEVTGGMFNTNGGITSFVVANTDEATKAAYPYVAK